MYLEAPACLCWRCVLGELHACVCCMHAGAACVHAGAAGRAGGEASAARVRHSGAMQALTHDGYHSDVIASDRCAVVLYRHCVHHGRPSAGLFPQALAAIRCAQQEASGVAQVRFDLGPNCQAIASIAGLLGFPCKRQAVGFF